MMRKKIVWVTPINFMDNNKDVVPYLSREFDIHWIILASTMPSDTTEIVKLGSSSLKVEFYVVSSRWYSLFCLFSYIKFFNYLKRLECDAIYYNKSPQLWEYYAARFCLPCSKAVFALHNVKVPQGARYEKMARYYMKRLVKNFDNFHVFSYNQKEYLETLCKGKNILYAPLPLIDFGAKEERTDFLDKVNFLAFGYIRKYKRFDLLIDAAQMLFEETKQPFVVTIVGKCNNWEDYNIRIKYPELFNLHIGFVEDEKVSHFFSNCDYLVQPYQDLAQSGPLMLALNYHVPVIASNIPAFKEFIVDNETGYFFETEDAMSLKQLIKNLLELTDEQRRTIVENVKRYADENHSMESLLQKYKSYFDGFNN